MTSPPGGGPRAAVDCGTNSTRLLVDDGSGVVLARELTITRLGQDVDRTGRLADEALTRTLDAIAGYHDLWTSLGVAPERVRIAATSAVRDAANRDEYFDGVRRVTGGVSAVVLSGEEEAAASFRGATAGMDEDGPIVVIDIGGGSTEVVVGERGGDVVGHSMQLGSVRLTERHLHTDPPTPTEVMAARDAVTAQLRLNATSLQDRGARVSDAVTAVGVAGTVTTIAALAREHGAWVDGAVHGITLDRDDVRGVTMDLLARTAASRATEVAIQPGREDVIHGGAMILDALMEFHGLCCLHVSESDILDGLLHGIP